MKKDRIVMEDVIQVMVDLKSFGYKNPELNPRYFGGPWCLESPTGILILEDKFEEELVKCLEGYHE